MPRRLIALHLLLALLARAQPAAAARRSLAQAPLAPPAAELLTPAAEPFSPVSELGSPGGIGGPQVDVCISLTNTAGGGCSTESDTSERGGARPPRPPATGLHARAAAAAAALRACMHRRGRHEAGPGLKSQRPRHAAPLPCPCSRSVPRVPARFDPAAHTGGAGQSHLVHEGR